MSDFMLMLKCSWLWSLLPNGSCISTLSTNSFCEDSTISNTLAALVGSNTCWVRRRRIDFISTKQLHISGTRMYHHIVYINIMIKVEMGNTYIILSPHHKQNIFIQSLIRKWICLHIIKHHRPSTCYKYANQYSHPCLGCCNLSSNINNEFFSFCHPILGIYPVPDTTTCCLLLLCSVVYPT